VGGSSVAANKLKNRNVYFCKDTAVRGGKKSKRKYGLQGRKRGPRIAYVIRILRFRTRGKKDVLYRLPANLHQTGKKEGKEDGAVGPKLKT